MKQEITIQTEEDLCGDEYLRNGEMVITSEGSLIHLKDDHGFSSVVSIEDLESAIRKLKA